MSGVAGCLLKAGVLGILVGLLVSGCSATDKSTMRLSLAAVGDTNGYNMRRDDGSPLEAVQDLLDDYDVFLFNHEGVLHPGQARGHCRRFPKQSLLVSDPWVASSLRPARNNIATLANNHVLECGAEGIQQTKAILDAETINTVGAGNALPDACKPLWTKVNGVRLAVVAYLAMQRDWIYARSDSPGAASWQACDGTSQVARLAGEADLVVVVLHMHMARGWTDDVPPSHLALVRTALEAGADVVIGHGSHVPQAVIRSDAGIGLLSLGNFLFRPDYRMPEPAHRSLVAAVRVTPEGLGLDLHPIILDPAGKPRPARPEEAATILTRVADLSMRYGTRIEIHEGVGRLFIERSQ